MALMRLPKTKDSASSVSASDEKIGQAVLKLLRPENTQTET